MSSHCTANMELHGSSCLLSTAEVWTVVGDAASYTGSMIRM